MNIDTTNYKLVLIDIILNLYTVYTYNTKKRYKYVNIARHKNIEPMTKVKIQTNLCIVFDQKIKDTLFDSFHFCHAHSCRLKSYNTEA